MSTTAHLVSFANLHRPPQTGVELGFYFLLQTMIALAAMWDFVRWVDATNQRIGSGDIFSTSLLRLLKLCFELAGEGWSNLIVYVRPHFSIRSWRVHFVGGGVRLFNFIRRFLSSGQLDL